MAMLHPKDCEEGELMTRAPGTGDSPPAPRAKGPGLPQKGGLPALSCVENAGSLELREAAVPPGCVAGPARC